MQNHGPDCGDPDELDKTLAQALEHMLASIDPVAGFETVSTRDALDRILHESIISLRNLPAYTNSAMDGYALAGEQLPAVGHRSFRVVGTAFAGHGFSGSVGTDECVRIMTGAVIPAGTDTVVMQERVRREGDRAIISSGHPPGENVRLAGEDLAAGDEALPAGLLLQPAHISLIASLGIVELRVGRRPRIACFSTGDELIAPGDPLDEGQIHDSNRYAIRAMLERLGLDILDLGIVRDQPEELERAVQMAVAQGDAVITTGGVSVGEADYVSELVARLGRIDFSRVAIKPGRAFVFGHIDAVPFFGLPGNPVSSLVAFSQLVRPALHRLMGRLDEEVPLLIRATCDSPVRKKPGRREYQRGHLRRGTDGRYRVSTSAGQGSGMLHSMATANCFVVLDAESGSLEAGAEVAVQPFSSIF